jgi:hypothetical protein
MSLWPEEGLLHMSVEELKAAALKLDMDERARLAEKKRPSYPYRSSICA